MCQFFGLCFPNYVEQPENYDDYIENLSDDEYISNDEPYREYTIGQSSNGRTQISNTHNAFSANKYSYIPPVMHD